MSGALYFIARRADPDVRVTFGLKDAAYVALADLGVLGLLYVYTRARSGPCVDREEGRPGGRLEHGHRRRHACHGADRHARPDAVHRPG